MKSGLSDGIGFCDNTVTDTVLYSVQRSCVFWNYESWFNTFGGAGPYLGLYLYRTQTHGTATLCMSVSDRLLAQTNDPSVTS